MKIIRIFLFYLIIPILIFTPLDAKDKKKAIVGVVFDGQWFRNAEMIEMLKADIKELTEYNYDVEIPAGKILTGDWRNSSIRNHIEFLMNDEDVDIIAVLGMKGALEISKIGKFDKPVVAPFIDGVSQGSLIDKGFSKVENLCLIHIESAFETDIISLQSSIPFENLVIILNEQLSEYYEPTAKALNFFEDRNITASVVKRIKGIEPVIEAIPKNSDAVIITPQATETRDEFIKLLDFLNGNKIKSFSAMGEYGVERGLLASSRKDLLPKLVRRIALNIQRILIGDKPDKIPVEFSYDKQLTINMETARTIDFYPSWGTISEAVLLNMEEKIISDTLNLEQAVWRGVNKNLDLLAKDHSVRAGEQDIRSALSNLLPQVDLSATGLILDEDRAAASMGSAPEKQVFGSISATQVLFSEKAWANYSIQNSLQLSRVQEYEQLKLDIALEVAETFLNLLKAEAYLKIQQENVERTTANLEVARIRESTGSSGPGEVYRWESELATARIELVNATATTKILRVAVNRLLHNDLGFEFTPASENVYTERLLRASNLIPKYLGNARNLDLFEEFIVERAKRNSPEIRQINALTEVRERALTSAYSSFWMPTIALQGELSYYFDKSGAGSDGFDMTGLPPEQQWMANIFPEQADDLNWNIGLNISFPLFEGTKKFADKIKAREELDEIKKQKQSVELQIEQAIRSSLYNASASYASIKMAQRREEAARKSLVIMEDSYARGVVSIIQLLDIQNNYLRAQQAAASAVYDFIIDLMTVERFAGYFYLLEGDEKMEQFRIDLENYLKENK